MVVARRTAFWLSGAIAVLAVPVHLIGLLRPAIYRDPAVLLPQNMGTDLITLTVGVPLLTVTAWLAHRGSSRARVLWLGTLAFLAYDYGMYALGVRWNGLFLAYLALFTLSLYALIIGLVTTDAAGIRASASRRPPARSVAAYLLLVTGVVAAVWLAEELGALARGIIPPSVTQLETPTNIVHVFDLGIVFPAMVLAAVMLLRDRPWGYVWAGVLLIKASTIGLWVLAMIWFSARQGIPSPAPYIGLFAGITLIGGLLAWRLVWAVGDPGAVRPGVR